MSATARYGLTLTVLLLITSFSARAIEQLAVQIGVWSSEQLTIEKLQFAVDLSEEEMVVIATADRVQLPAPFGVLEKVRLRCDSLRWLAGKIECSKGQLAFSHPQWGTQQITFSVQTLAKTEHYQITLNNIRLGEGVIDLQANYQQGQWQAQLMGQQLAIQNVLQLASFYSDTPELALLEQWNADAIVDLEANVSGRQQLDSAAVSSHLSGLSFSDPTGRYVAEQVAATLQLELQADAKQVSWQQTLHLQGGQTYFEPIFFDLAAQNILLRSEGDFSFTDNQWKIHNVRFEQGQNLTANGRLSGQSVQPQSLNIDINSSNLTTLYHDWLQPFFPGSSLSQLDASGKASANLQWQAEAYQVNMDLQSVNLKDAAGRFSIDALNGQIAWTNYATTLPINLQWQAASVFALPLGGSTLKAEVSQNQLRFTESVSVPVLDGELSVSNIQMSLSEEAGVRWQFQGLLSPVSMESLSALFGWPALQGKVSGMIPNVSYADDIISVDGALLLKVFDGSTIVRDLRLQQPFGSLPQLYANIDIQRLDLQTLTSTFDFGNISGKLDGRIHNLRLSDWQPVQFDAHFATPDTEPGRRRISQRAVNSLSQLGGGPTAILSRGFMGLFEDFSYQKLGLSCRLMNTVCQMDGVEAREQGYYIVKGGGLPPWINVVGYTREVDWPELIARLKAVSQSDGPVIQ